MATTRKKFSPKIRRERPDHKAKVARASHGEGHYVFRNKSNHATLSLAKPSMDGKKMIAPQGTWEGDSYFLEMVPRDATIVKVIQSEQDDKNERIAANKEEKLMNEQQEKLILDQPETITEAGTVEHVTDDTVEGQVPLKEGPDALKSGEVLLTEDPMDGVEIIEG